MKMRRFFTFITGLALAGALSDMTVDVKRGQNVTLPVKTPEMGDVNRVTFCKLNKNGTQVPIFRYCSDIEKKRGCTAIDTDRFSHKLGSDNVSVIIRDASATDAGTYNVEVIGNNVIEETFTVVFTESSDGRSVTVNPPFIIIVGPHITVSPPYIIRVVISLVIILVVIAIIVVTVVSVCICKKKNRKKLVFLNSTVDSEVGDSQSSITGADKRERDESSEKLCLVDMQEKKPEDLDSTHPDALHLINNNNSTSSNNDSSSNNNFYI